MDTKLRVYGDLKSGNCQKVIWIADALGVAYEFAPVDIMRGETRTEAFLALNPAGQIPVLEFPDGRTLAQSNAIIRFLARGSRYLPDDPFAQAKIDEWLFWEQYSHEPYIAVARFQMSYLGKAREALDPKLHTRGDAALDLMDAHLATRDWLCGSGPSVADAALVAYTRVADEGGFDLKARASLMRWVVACENEFRIGATT